LVTVIVSVLFKIDYFSSLNLEFLKSNRDELHAYAQAHHFKSKAFYFLIYVTLATFSIPGAVFLALLAPSLFNFVDSYFLVIMGSTTGAATSFYLKRFFLKDWARKVFAKQFKKYHKQITEHQKAFLLTLRLIPIFPFSWVTLLYCTTDIKIFDYIWITFAGMTPGILVNLYAGLQLSQIQKMSDLYSPRMIIAFLLMALFPIVMQRIVKKFKLLS
jgi:uncharacterized membrane protein YdjX (TVP38/TMEM64 family)